jgi:ribosomal-protein-alanine N-acetyltransferase
MESRDIPFLVEIESLSESASRWTKGMLDRELELPFSLSLVASRGSGESPVAFGIVWVVGEESHLLEFAVHPRFRRKGVGRKLLGRLIQSARTKGCRKMELEFRQGNLAARRLYEKAGFVLAGRRKSFYDGYGNPGSNSKEERDALLMECKI